MDMSPDQAAALQQFRHLVHHSPFDVWIALLGVVVVCGLVALFMTRQKPPSPTYREKWQLEKPQGDLWSRYLRGWWWVP
jgi:hypothetical protein